MIKIITIGIGVLCLIVVLVLTAQFIADMMFNQKVEKEAAEFLSRNRSHQNDIITESDIEHLPAPVKRWLTSAQVVGKEKAYIVRLKQTGEMRTGNDKPWMPFSAEQYFSTEKPGFIWKAKVNMAPLVNMVARDKYDQGKGNMLIKALSFLTIGDSYGKEMDQGTALRFLAEMIWFPTGALSDYISWEAIDDLSARATIRYGDVTASATFNYDEYGDPVSFEAQRYGQFDGKYSMETWAGVTKEMKEFNGIRIPSQGDVTWKLKTGNFTWLNWTITDVEYNKPELYQ